MNYEIRETTAMNFTVYATYTTGREEIVESCEFRDQASAAAERYQNAHPTAQLYINDEPVANEAPRCATCAGEGDCPDCGTLEATTPTPGAWRIIEVRPAGDEWNTSGGTCFRADEGHMGVYSTNETETALHIYSNTAHMENLWGSGMGGHIATISIAYGAPGRRQALANAQAIVNAHNAAA